MTTNDLPNRARNPRLIPGIYNYCDRWCACCALTDRCLQFSYDADARAEDPQAVMTAVGRTLSDARGLARQAAITFGIEPDELERSDPHLMQTQTQGSRRASSDPLARLAMQYVTLAGGWLEAHRWPDDLVRIGNRPGPLAIIRWYQYFIAPKTHRAVRGADDPDHLSGEVQTDANGSAKAAILAIDRSRKAWLAVEHLSRRPDAPQVARILALLDALRHGLLQRFPFALAFLRPGFDEPRA